MPFWDPLGLLGRRGGSAPVWHFTAPMPGSNLLHISEVVEFVGVWVFLVFQVSYVFWFSRFLVVLVF